MTLLTGAAHANATKRAKGLAPPWGHATLGQLGRGGGAYSAAKIPFNERFRLTATMAEGELGFGIKGCILFSLCRGIENFGPIQLPSPGLSLPAEARLKRAHATRCENRAERTGSSSDDDIYMAAALKSKLK